MFINFWYPAGLSKDLKQEPLQRQILGQPLVLFRDADGTAHCLSNICVHRCASLAGGWTRGGRLVCPYHGWQYEGDGQCKHIPSLGPDVGETGQRARVDSYPTQEKYGLIFVFLGDLPEDERPPVMEVAEWDQPGWRSTVTSYEMKANYRRVIENALDFAHPEFVHFVGRKGEDPAYRVPDYAIEEHAWGGGAHVTFQQPASGLWRFFRDQGTTVVAGTAFHGPSQFITRIHIDEKMKTYQYAFEAPIDEFTVRTYLVNARNFFTNPVFDGIANKRNSAIIEEDRAIVENLQTAVGRDTSTEDLSVETDKIQIFYRQKLKAWEALGWRIDVDALNTIDTNKHTVVLPSPGRRTSRNWVFDTVPLKQEEGMARPSVSEALG